MTTIPSSHLLSQPRISFSDHHFTTLLIGLLASLTFFNWLQIDIANFTIRAVDVFIAFFIFSALILICFDTTISKSEHSLIWIPLFLYLGYMTLMPFLGLMFRASFDFSHVTYGFRFGLILVFCAALLLLSPRRRLLYTSLNRSLLFLGYPILFVTIGQILEYAQVLPGGFFLNQSLADMFDIKIDHYMRPPGTFAGPNQLGWYGAVIFSLSLAFYFTGGGARWAHISFIHFLIIVASTSRSALLAALFSVAAMYALSILRTFSGRQTTKPKGIALFILIALAFSFLVILAERLGFLRPQSIFSAFAVITGDFQADGSLAARFDGWSNALQAFRDYGFFGFLGDPRVVTGTIDSGWLNYLARGGIPLLAFFVLFLLTTTFYTIYNYLASGNQYSLALFGVTIIIPLGFVPLSALHYTHVMIFTILAFYMGASDPHRPRGIT
ncbi:O-antigen ligase family protein [Halorhodospira sp. 9622]|uniref:O-antigen ligase family protein n=1 Tax=Halorhodospira sp. 9622 TaxID=2899136 RepID=UPI001EE843B2|nr:O-antigen ligase family protein [Halorhodospira sp. 9622]MCG5539097.1 O-antigen ligase family protein [Halorhodospira sp. 9622]